MKALRTPNQIIAILLFVFSAFYLYMAINIPQFTLSVPVDSDLFPKVLGAMMLVLSVLLFFEKEKPKAEAESKADAGDEAASEADAGVVTASEADAGDEAESEADAGVVTASKDALGGRAESETNSANEPESGVGFCRVCEKIVSEPRYQVLVMTVAMVLYIFSFESMGFILSTSIFLFGMTLYLGYRKHWINLVVTLAITFAFYFGMTKGLGIYLPKGLLPI